MKSLQQRLIVFLLLPVALILFFTGLFGFVYVRGNMLNDWREASILRLERAAHFIDMRLSRPIELIEMFHKTGDKQGAYALQKGLLLQLKELEGTTKVNLEWKDKRYDLEKMRGQMRGRGSGMQRDEMMRFHRGRISEVTSPKYDTKTGGETISIISQFKDEAGQIVGSLEAVIRFDYLLKDIKTLGWWQSDTAFLVDHSGRFIAHTEKITKGQDRLGEANDALEIDVLKAIKEKPYGTIMGPGHPPRRVSGFYKISRAPWAVVLFAPGKKVLAPIIRFRLYYFLAGSFCIVVILLLIRFVGGGMVRRIREISQSAEQVAKGNYETQLPIKCCDEIGQLTQSFNTMIDGLKERDFISNTFGRYVDQRIAKELMKQPEAARLGGDRREVAIFMSDIRGFTSLSETLNPDVIISIVNRYFSRLIDIIQKHEGIIVDFFGDGILVFFDPLDGPVEPKVHNAVQCALEIQSNMEDFNAEMIKEGLPELKTGIGINAGEVIVGNIGSKTRAKYGIVGSAVNITQRIQSEAKGGNVVISESAYCCLSENLIIEKSFSVPLKGLQKPITLYEIKELKSQK